MKERKSELWMAGVMVAVYFMKSTGMLDYLPSPEDLTTAQKMLESRMTDWSEIVAGGGGISYVISRGIAKYNRGDMYV